MKALLLLSLLFSFNTFADFVKLSDFNSCDVVGYYDKHTCENEQGSECVKRPKGFEGECGIFLPTLQDVLIDDLEKPIRNKTNVTACESEEACRVALESLECEEKYINESYTEVYCSKITGYEQKFSHKIAVVDTEKVAQKQARENAIQQIEEAKRYLSETDYMLLRELDGGEPMPTDIKTQRASKRALINSLETEFGL